jgi:ankyrin repeat protein
MNDVNVLITAISEGDETEVQRLILTGINLNQRDEEGCTPLFYAVLMGNSMIVELLIAGGSDVNATALEPGATILADTPLDLAKQASFLMDKKKYEPIVQALLTHGAI